MDSMSLRIYVDAYSGYKANERPRRFQVDEDVFEIAEVEDHWYDPTPSISGSGLLTVNAIRDRPNPRE